MRLEYEKMDINVLIQTLERANDCNHAPIRCEMLLAKLNFFKTEFNNKNVLVAGSGLGDDSFKLAKFNKIVLGLEIVPQLLSISKNLKISQEVDNVLFTNTDFVETKLPDKDFDVSVLNMGTMCNFNDTYKMRVISEMLRVSDILYFSFYLPDENSLRSRASMYREEWLQESKIEDVTISNHSGLRSASISKQRVEELVSMCGYKVDFYSINSFTCMAKVY